MLIRQLLALVMFFLSALVVMLGTVSPRAPLRVIVAPLAWNLWAALGALPVLVWLLLDGTFGVAITALQLAAALVGLAGAWSLSGRPWLTEQSMNGRPAFSLARLALTLVGSPVIVVGSVLWVMLNVQYAVSWSTDGYVSVDLNGLYMAERRLRRGDDDVHLIGMVHLAEEGSFDELYRSFGELGPAVVVLEEGVTDRDSRLSTAGRGYEKVAERLGLQEQPRLTEHDTVEVRHADIDVSELSPEALQLITSIMGFYASDRPALAILNLQSTLDELGGDEVILQLLLSELVGRRNDRLEEEVHVALAEERVVVVPWGALHLPDLQSRLEGAGFAVVSEDRRLVVKHTTWVGAAQRLLFGVTEAP